MDTHILHDAADPPIKTLEFLIAHCSVHIIFEIVKAFAHDLIHLQGGALGWSTRSGVRASADSCGLRQPRLDTYMASKRSVGGIRHGAAIVTLHTRLH